MRYLLFLICFTVLSCSTQKENKNYSLSDIFISNKNTVLVLYKQNYILLASSESIYGPMGIDTLSYGSMSMDENFLVLNSDRKLDHKYPKITVKESFSKSKDSIYINIKNENEGLYDVEGKLNPFVLYRINFDGQIINQDNYYKTNKIILPRYPEDKIYKIYVEIFPNLELFPLTVSHNVIYPNGYKIEKTDSNTFEIDIKNFNFKNFIYKRYFDDYIKIIDDNTLKWDKDIYKRK